MIFTQDMKDLIEIMERHEVEYVLVGGFAVNFYGYVRTTHDVDILVNPSFENARKMVKALEEFGFGSDGVPAVYFETEGTAIHMGVEPNRIDPRRVSFSYPVQGSWIPLYIHRLW